MYELIRKYEGCRLTAYKCPAGVWTIGYGTTVYPNGQPVREGDKISRAEAEAFLTMYIKQNITAHRIKFQPTGSIKVFNIQYRPRRI